MIFLILALLFPNMAFARGKLVVKDGSKIYFQQEFANRQDAETWLAEERTRPYWRQHYTVTITDNDAAEAAAEAARLAADKAAEELKEKPKKDRRDRIKSIDWNKVKTFEDLKPIIKDLVDDKD